ncbi:hypothetical protein Ae201684P_003676 [Aphanomyces euteiches]|nr:hypothetical protein Ae201684P_003676 [Aphanomyces euteiches]
MLFHMPRLCKPTFPCGVLPTVSNLIGISLIANFTMNSSNNMSVRGGVRQQGIYEWNGEGRILGMVPPRSRCKRTTRRCGNCGAFNHITIDCLALQTSLGDTKASL